MLHPPPLDGTRRTAFATGINSGMPIFGHQPLGAHQFLRRRNSGLIARRNAPPT